MKIRQRAVLTIGYLLLGLTFSLADDFSQVGNALGNKLRSQAVFALEGIALDEFSAILPSNRGQANKGQANKSQSDKDLEQNSAPKSPKNKADSQEITPRLYAVSPTILALDIPAPAVTKGSQMPYKAQANDTLVQKNDKTTVVRAGADIGTLVKPNNGEPLLYTYDEVTPSPIRLRLANKQSSYRITSPTDARYTSETQPAEVFRKSKPAGFVDKGGDFSWPAKHTLFLTLEEPLEAGNTYSVSFPELAPDIAELSFDYQPNASRSEALQVSQLGFRPDDPLKVGYLSMWLGDGGGLDYPDNLEFQLIEVQTEEAVYNGTAQQVHTPNQSEDARDRDYTLTEVHQLDFSSVSQPGNYRLCVEGIGCSFNFPIGQNVWQEAFTTSARGFYHQRSGIAIGAPHSEFSRPRAYHPEDGLQVYQSGATLLEVEMGLGSLETFSTLSSKKTETLVPNAWGGYFDAGDWDRRTHHLSVPRGLLELHNLFPEHFKTASLNIPESQNQLPDIVDEALWSVDFFRRLQTPEGGIRGGIQAAAEITAYGTGSWQEPQLVMAYAPDVWSSYTYAGVAARAAFTLKSYDPERASTYQESALKAMAYAEANYQEGTYTEELQHHVKDQRNLAALELYRLTQDSQWHELFLATTLFNDPAAEVSVYGQQEQRDAAFLYARLNTAELNTTESSEARTNDPTLSIDAQVQENAKNAFLRYADTLVALTQTSAFGWSKDHPESPIGWGNGLGAPQGVNLLQAHALTQNQKYLLAGISSTQFPGGANPDNTVFTTGLGDRSPQNPLIIDQRITNQAPPPGITIYGPSDLSFYNNYWTIEEIASDTFPAPQQWPTAENYFDIYLYPMGAEFTVDYMLLSTYTWGYLAARPSSSPGSSPRASVQTTSVSTAPAQE
ncbi:MAG: glycoside hydrolase family 9 protein [Cyanobacteria bacterium J06649_5]